MALVIRLRQQGAKNAQTYRLVVTDVRTRRDGKYIEMLGWYNPACEGAKSVSMDVTRLQHWMSLGANLTEKAEHLVKSFAPEVMQQLHAKKEEQRIQKRKNKKKKKESQ